MSNHLETIVALHRALSTLKAAESELAGIPDWMRELHAEHTSRQLDIEALGTALETAVGEHRAAESAIADNQEKLRHYQQQMSLVQTQREYGALLKEIDTSKAAIGELEDEAFSAMERHEKAKRELAEQQQAFADLDSRYRAELGRWESEKPAIAARIAEVRATVDNLRQKLPRAYLAQFERITVRIPGDAIAVARRVERVGTGPVMYSCSSCNYRVRPQVVVEIRNTGALVQCDSCKRILCVQEDG